MIIYEKDAYALGLLFRIHGSAVFRALIPALVALGLFLVFRYVWDAPSKTEILHPYACGVLIGGITFLIIFRLTQSYGRYWEATGAVYRMQSKWMDGTVQVGNFHMQSTEYDKIKPPSFRKYPQLNAEFLTRARERIRPSQSNKGTVGKISESRAILRSINFIQNKKQERKDHDGTKNVLSNIPDDGSAGPPASPGRKKLMNRISTKRFQSANDAPSSSNDDYDGVPRFLTGEPKMDGNWGALFDDGKSTYMDPKDPTKIDSPGFASTQGGRTPSLFLQELAHLTSLLNAVALSTLRNDVEGAESPLGLYEPGSPWPPVDPNNFKNLYDTRMEGYWHAFSYFMGKGRSPEEQTRYNAARPLPVLGGVRCVRDLCCVALVFPLRNGCY
jgi:hypothetical protein